jgi:hypothetical protein
MQVKGTTRTLGTQVRMLILFYVQCEVVRGFIA